TIINHMKILHNLKESFISAINSLKINKLRTFLTLFGITIGIFAIISVFTIVDSLERTIRDSLSSLGDNVIYVQKWPWTPPPGEEYAWWEYLNRPLPAFDEYEYLNKNINLAEAVVFTAQTQRNVSYQNRSIRNSTVAGYTHDFYKIRSFNISEGRYFSELESTKGKNVAIIGSKIAEELFGNMSPINKEMKISGFKTVIIGVFQKEGQDIIGAGGSLDNLVIIPLNYGKKSIDLRNEQANPAIILQSNENIHVQELKYETRRLMRAIRTLQPAEKDNFAINQATMISGSIDQLFGVINVAGWLIGGFSIIVGGFGIANIMFVSVKERTHIIGIEKAIGAKNYFILSQFLFEAIILALIGGAIGLLLIFGGSLIASNLTSLKVTLTLSNILLGLFISAVIGVISGFAPARSAAKLNPVEAINTTF
ncbi:MAG: ABC transporter permease, partial [Bacteroidales bacterium]